MQMKQTARFPVNVVKSLVVEWFEAERKKKGLKVMVDSVRFVEEGSAPGLGSSLVCEVDYTEEA